MADGGGRAIDDAEAVARVLNGDVEAYRVLVERYRTAYGRLATALCGDADLAADAMQEAFIRAFDGLATCARPERFGAWFHRILRNQCANHRTRRRQHAPLDAQPLSARERADDSLQRAELRSAIQSAIDALSAEQREAFVLRHVEGRPYAEMAELLDEREDALRMRVHRARDAIRRQLEGTL
jgi:RNA polymerase sigma-70 factor (ECF subfamily)